VQVVRQEGGPERDRAAVRVPEDARRLADRVDKRGDVLELALDRVLRVVPALASTAAIDRVDGEAILEQRREEGPAPVRAGDRMKENERRPHAASPVGDPGPVQRAHMLEHRETIRPRQSRLGT
jgi:hypothetical protein